jgi:hypothetical protein
VDDADGHLGTAAHAGLSAAAGVNGDLADVGGGISESVA